MLETTVRLLVALEASVVTVVAVTLEAMEETVALAAVGKQYFPLLLSVIALTCSLNINSL